MFRTEVYNNMYVWKDYMLGQIKSQEQLQVMKNTALRTCKQLLVEYIWPPKQSPKYYISFTREQQTQIIKEYNADYFKEFSCNKVNLCI